MDIPEDQNLRRGRRLRRLNGDAYPNSSRAAELEKVGRILREHGVTGTNPVSQ